MSKPKLSDEEITRRGRELYENSIRQRVETPGNIGKIISINVETGEYEIGDDLLVTSSPPKQLCGVRQSDITVPSFSVHPWF